MKAYTKLKETRHDLSEVIPLSKPYTLLIEPSSYCNFRCVSCFQSLSDDAGFRENRAMMPMEMYRGVIEQMKAWGNEPVKVLKLSMYGEPLTHPAFLEMLRLAHEAGIAGRIETTTNASLITKEIARGLVECGIDYIRVSIYGATQERYHEVTGTEDARIADIYRNLEWIQEFKRKASSEKPFVSVKMLDTFGEENDEFIRRFSPVADETYIDTPHNWVASEEKNFLYSLYTSSEKRAAMLEKQKENQRNRSCCPMPFTTLAVRSDGRVAPCCVDWQGGTCIGNVKDSSLRDIWTGEEMLRFWKIQLTGSNRSNPSCRNCEYYKSTYYMLDDLDGYPVERFLALWRERIANVATF